MGSCATKFRAGEILQCLAGLLEGRQKHCYSTGVHRSKLVSEFARALLPTLLLALCSGTDIWLARIPPRGIAPQQLAVAADTVC